MCIKKKYKKKVFYKYFLEYKFNDNCINNSIIL